ncbi:unnamed protein product [Sphagnum jensenii]|uniref:Uncharacterized protein n=1 Tax=Sphagnum jensenii TaxID=128206 RepID=A0ABP0W5E9_9BRYO
MADKPSRALVIYGDGLLPVVGPQHRHLHELAVSGSCGFLALRALPPSVVGGERLVTELAQLIDVHDAYTSCVLRFMGMKAVMVSNSKPGSALGKRAGFSVVAFDDILGSSIDANGVKTSSLALRLLNLLGLEESGDNVPDSNHFELVFLHLAATNTSDAETGTTWLDFLLGSIKDLSKPGTKAYSHLFLVTVLGYGDLKTHVPVPPTLKQDHSLHPDLEKLWPRQSYTVKAGKPVDGIREDYPLLAVYNQVAVTRRDKVTAFGFEEFKKHGGNGTILADRFLYEVAFKLWKAPKYGA